MTRVTMKRQDGVFISSKANGDRSLSVVTLTADTVDAYEVGTILVDDGEKFIRASEATVEQIADITRAVFLRDRTFAEVDTQVLVLERAFEGVEHLTDIDELSTATRAAVVALITAAGIVLR
ncbi:hypothetical protein [Pararhizobium sp.]|uniref:hypothetical protein n=1 Tax=Pararhizobium sp. TaxID=1977563 RepID=UPI003D09677A